MQRLRLLPLALLLVLLCTGSCGDQCVFKPGSHIFQNAVSTLAESEPVGQNLDPYQCNGIYPHTCENGMTTIIKFDAPDGESDLDIVSSAGAGTGAGTPYSYSGLSLRYKTPGVLELRLFDGNKLFGKTLYLKPGTPVGTAIQIVIGYDPASAIHRLYIDGIYFSTIDQLNENRHLTIPVSMNKYNFFGYTVNVNSDLHASVQFVSDTTPAETKIAGINTQDISNFKLSGCVDDTALTSKDLSSCDCRYQCNSQSDSSYVIYDAQAQENNCACSEENPITTTEGSCTNSMEVYRTTPVTKESPFPCGFTCDKEQDSITVGAEGIIRCEHQAAAQGDIVQYQWSSDDVKTYDTARSYQVGETGTTTVSITSKSAHCPLTTVEVSLVGEEAEPADEPKAIVSVHEAAEDGSIVVNVSVFSEIDGDCRFASTNPSDETFEFQFNSGVTHKLFPINLSTDSALHQAHLKCANSGGETNEVVTIAKESKETTWLVEESGYDRDVTFSFIAAEELVYGIDYSLYVDGVALQVSKVMIGDTGTLVKSADIQGPSDKTNHVVEIKSLPNNQNLYTAVVSTPTRITEFSITCAPAYTVGEYCIVPSSETPELIISLMGNDVDVKITAGDYEVYLYAAGDGQGSLRQGTFSPPALQQGDLTVEGVASNQVSSMEDMMNLYITGPSPSEPPTISVRNATVRGEPIEVIGCWDGIPSESSFFAMTQIGSGDVGVIRFAPGTQEEESNCRTALVPVPKHGYYTMELLVFANRDEMQHSFTFNVASGTNVDEVEISVMSEDGTNSERSTRYFVGDVINITVMAQGDPVCVEVNIKFEDGKEEVLSKCDVGLDIDAINETLQEVFSQLGSGVYSDLDMQVKSEDGDFLKENERKKRSNEQDSDGLDALVIDYEIEDFSGSGEDLVIIFAAETENAIKPPLTREHVFRYELKQSGKASIKTRVTSGMNKEKVTREYCPGLLVLEQSALIGECDFDIKVPIGVQETTPAYGFEWTFTGSEISNCALLNGMVAQIKYDYFVEKLLSDGQRKPETQNCLGIDENKFEMTGWYAPGTYIITVIPYVSVPGEDGSWKATLIKPNQPSLITLVYKQSPLEGEIKVLGGGTFYKEENKAEFNKTGVVSVCSVPIDPDVAANNVSHFTETFIVSPTKLSPEQLKQPGGYTYVKRNPTNLINRTTVLKEVAVFNTDDFSKISVAGGCVSFPAKMTDHVKLVMYIILEKDGRKLIISLDIDIILGEDIGLSEKVGMAANLYASGDYRGCLAFMQTIEISTSESEDANKKDAKKKADEAQNKLLDMTSKIADQAEDVQMTEEVFKAVGQVSKDPSTTGEATKTNAAESVKKAGQRTNALNANASKEEVLSAAGSALNVITKITPTTKNQRKPLAMLNQTKEETKKLRFTHENNDQKEEEIEENRRKELEESCCLKPQLDVQKDYPEFTSFVVPVSFCEFVEDPTDPETNFTSCGFYYWYEDSRTKNLSEEAKMSIVEKCKDPNSVYYTNVKNIAHGFSIWRAEYQPKNVTWTEEECNKYDNDTRVNEFLPMYRFFLLYTQKIEFAEKKKTMESVEDGSDSLMTSMCDKTSPGMDSGVSTKDMSMECITLDSDGSHSRFRRSGTYLVATDGSAELPPGVAKKGSSIQQQKNDDNAFTYCHNPADCNLNSATAGMKITEKGEEIKIANLTEPIAITINNTKKTPSPNSRVIDVASPNQESLSITKKGLSVLIQLRPDNDEDRYALYCILDDSLEGEDKKLPNKTYYDVKATLPREGDNYSEKEKYTYVLPANITTNKTGTFRCKIYVQKYMLEPGMTTYLNYTISLATASCLFWDKKADTWKSDGCTLSNKSTIGLTVCECNHLTTFGGDFVVPPNTIDFSTVFSAEKFLESMPVFCTVIIIMLLYVSGLVWARREDKKDLIKWGASPLEDNLPSDNYHYQVTINTGVRKKAGTKSRVSFILSGDDCDTGVRRLYDGKRKDLPAGSIYNYILSTEQCLGPLTYLRIWHDNSGKGIDKGWYLDQIQITDLQNGDRFFFLCDRWLAVEEDDGMVERILPVAGLSDLSAFKHLFSSSVRKKLTNDHLWFSVVSRPTRSNFTRVQRISCCVSLLFLTMITNCMFFKSDEKAENVAAVSIGPFSFTLHQLFISVVTTLIVFPPSLAIVTIFRKAKPKKTSIMQLNQSLSQKSKKFRWRTLNPGSSLWTNVEKSKMQKFKDNMRNIMSFKAKQKYETEPEEQRQAAGPTKKKKKGWSLPWWTMYIAWTLVFFSVVASGFFTILYSMEWGREKSLEWLSTFVLSFFQSVVVVQPIKVLLLAAFISCIMRKPELDNEEDDFDDCQAGPSAAQSNLTSSQRNLQEIIKQRQMAATEVKPPDMESLEKARAKRLQEMQMEAILKECIVYFFFIIVLFFLSYQARDADSFIYAQNIKSQFLDNSPNFGSITTPASFWAWCYGVLLPNMYSSEWYNGRALDWREALQVGDRSTVRVGVGRMRQLRIKEDSCDVQDVFEKMITHCRDHYNWIDDDTKDYLPGWTLPEKGTYEEELVYADVRSAWVYRNSVELKNAPYAGLLTMYKGGGYTFDFRRSKSKTERLMKLMESQEWISVKTRAVFVEYTLYNANVNLFASVIQLVEFMATGAAITKTEVKVFRLNSYVGGFGIIVIFFEVVYLGFTLFFFGKMCKDLKKQKLKYFKDFWNMLEFATLILSLIAIVMYAMKKVFGTVAMNVLHDSGARDFVNFVTISIWDEMFGFILAMVVFLATLKFIKMLRFNKRMGMLGDTIRVATRDLKYFCITFFIYFFAFCQWAYLMFGHMLPSYGSFIGSAEALFAFALGSFDFYEFQEVHRILGPFFFFLYVGVVYIGLMGMFLTIIYDAFASVKADTELRSNDYEIVDFMMKKFKGVFGWGGSS